MDLGSWVSMGRCPYTSIDYARKHATDACQDKWVHLFNSCPLYCSRGFLHLNNNQGQKLQPSYVNGGPGANISTCQQNLPGLSMVSSTMLPSAPNGTDLDLTAHAIALVVLMRPTTTSSCPVLGTNAPTLATPWASRSAFYFSRRTPWCFCLATPPGDNKAGAPFGGAWVGSGD
jgi:hypothetical protein